MTSKKAWTISIAASVLLVAGVFVALFGLGYHFFVVETPSMATTAPVGTLVVVHARDSYAIGDVISYQAKTRVYTHRIVDQTAQGWITKGDLNGAADPLPVTTDQIIGTVDFYGKYMGFFVRGLPWVLLGWALIFAATMHPRIPTSWRWQIRLIGWSLVVSLVALWLRPWVNLVMTGYVPAAVGVDMHLVNTGIFPVDVLGTVLQSGQDATVNQTIADPDGKYRVTPTLALTVGWLVLLFSICITPFVASLFIKVEDDSESEPPVATPTKRLRPAIPGVLRPREVGLISMVAVASVTVMAILLQAGSQATFASQITNSTDTAGTRTWFTCKNAAVGTSTARFAWALDTVSASTVQDLTTNNLDGTVTGSVSTSASTSCPRDTPVRSLSFTGSTGGACIRQTSQITAPKQYSIEVWFKTPPTTNANGKLIGFGNATTAADGSYDRHLYIDSAGRLIFGTYMRSDNTQHVIVTPTSVDDGAWHHAVATSTTAGALALYVDGSLVGTTTISNQETYNGYWKVGCGNLATWQDRTTTWIGTWPRYYTGQLRFAAVYTTVLSATQAKEHYLAGV